MEALLQLPCTAELKPWEKFHLRYKLSEMGSIQYLDEHGEGDIH